MSYDLYLLRESDAFPRDSTALVPILGAYLEAWTGDARPSDDQARLVEKTLGQLADLGPTIGVDLGFAGDDVICISIAYWDGTAPHLPDIIQILNAVQSDLGPEWFFYDPQIETTARQVSAPGVQTMFERNAPTLEPASWYVRVGRSMWWPPHRTRRQKWTDAAIIAAVGSSLIYAVFG